MLANWVRETTATVGTGTTIALGGAPASYTPFSSRLVNGQLTQVTFTDGNNRQLAICTYNTTGNTLTINSVIENLIAGVLTVTSVTPMSLSGSAVVDISASAQDVAQLALGPIASANLYMIPDNISVYGTLGKGGTIFGATAGTITCTYALFRSIKKITSVFANIGTVSAGGNFRLGLCYCNDNGTPGNLIFDSGNLSTTNTGIIGVTLPAPIYLLPGNYYMLDAVDNIVAQADGVTGGSGDNGAPFGMQKGVGNGPGRPQLAQTYGAFPLNLSAAVSHGSNGASFGSYWQ